MLRTLHVGVATLALSSLGACTQRNDARTVGGRADSSLGTTSTGGDVTSSTVGPQGDAQILVMLSEADEAEIAAARLALQKGARASVKMFARQMIADHTKMLEKGRSLANTLNLSTQSPTSDSLVKHAQQETQTLNRAAPGRQFDKVYLDAQVQDHQTVLSLLQQFEGQAQHPELKALITGAEPTVRTHLEQARHLDGQLATQS
jgi:putative membrane protein